MHSTTPIIPLLPLLLTITTTLAAPGVGQHAAVLACRGFPNGAVKCLTDVSYTVCMGDKGHGSEQEYFVNPGTHCEQGILGKKIDVANVMGVATMTRTFVQFGTDNQVLTSAVATGTLDAAQINSLFATTA